MPAIQEITESLIRDHIQHAVAEVFGTMLRSPVTLNEVPKALPPPTPMTPAGNAPWVVGTVGFVGDINGLIYLYFSEDFATNCTEKMLGMSAAEVAEGGNEVVNDAVGELTNMVVGSFKNRLCDAGLPCKLTVPSILRGQNFRIEGTGTARRYAYVFDCSGRRMVADILMNAD